MEEGLRGGEVDVPAAYIQVCKKRLAVMGDSTPPCQPWHQCQDTTVAFSVPLSAVSPPSHLLSPGRHFCLPVLG